MALALDSKGGRNLIERGSPRRDSEMSKRFLRWIDVWIEDNVASGSGGDVEAFDTRARRLAEELLAIAAAAGFKKDEIDEEAAKVAGLIETKLASRPAFDLSQFGVAGDD